MLVFCGKNGRPRASFAYFSTEVVEKSKGIHSGRSSEVSGIYRSSSSDLPRSLRSAGHRSWQIRKPAPHSKLRKLRQRAPARSKGLPDHLLTARYACFVPMMQKTQNNLNFTLSLFYMSEKWGKFGAFFEVPSARM